MSSQVRAIERALIAAKTFEGRKLDLRTIAAVMGAVDAELSAIYNQHERTEARTFFYQFVRIDDVSLEDLRRRLLDHRRAGGAY